MSKLLNRFEDVLLNIAESVDDNKYLSSIKNAFTIFMPFVIVGSFATLFNTFLTSPTTGLAKWIPALEKIKPAFTAVNFATMSFMTIPIIFLIAMKLAKYNKVPEYITGVIAVAAYIAVIPEVVTVVIDKATGTAAGIPGSALGAQGLFTGMILAILVTELFSMLTKIKAIKIKMPPSVPTAISDSFNALIPIMITLIITALIGNLFLMLTGSYLNDFFYKILQAPLEAIFQSPAGIIAIVIISQLFWFLGIHGGLIISPIRNPLVMAAIAANIAAVNAGQVATQAVTAGFWVCFVIAGGSGITLSLIFAIFMFSKRDDHRMIAKLSFLPGICGVGEPMVFGIPLVLNPTFAIPFIFNSGIATAIALFATKIGFLACSTVDAPFGLPILVGPFISYGVPGIIVQVIIFAVCTLTWAPFVLMSNKQANNEVINEA